MPFPAVGDKTMSSTDHILICFMFSFYSVDNMGRGLITVLKKAGNGSLWVIENNEPAHELKLEYSRV